VDDLIDFVKIFVGIVVGIISLVFIVSLPWMIFGGTRVADIKQAAPQVWASNGFQVLGYQGYELTLFARPGGCVWYTVKRDNTVYQGCISMWGDEYHIYSLRALNAIKGD
jgi:hypothetical protein